MAKLANLQRTDLIRRACRIRDSAYAPYSQFMVGASLLTVGGEFFDGVNVENASFGLTNCAERTAIFAAITAGKHQWLGMAIASQGGFAPCGACRQVIVEFQSALPVLLIDPARPDDVTEMTMDQLLPGRFILPETRNHD